MKKMRYRQMMRMSEPQAAADTLQMQHSASALLQYLTCYWCSEAVNADIQCPLENMSGCPV